jgi:acyl-CoA synthetase (AMP-forming)/AMP-acid ligase II
VSEATWLGVVAIAAGAQLAVLPGEKVQFIIAGLSTRFHPAMVVGAAVMHAVSLALGESPAGAVGIDDEKWGEKVVGFVQTDEEVSAEELDQHCRDSDLENFKRPKDYVFVEDMPLNETGGVERKKLRDMYG